MVVFHFVLDCIWLLIELSYVHAIENTASPCYRLYIEVLWDTHFNIKVSKFVGQLFWLQVVLSAIFKAKGIDRS